MTNNWEKFRPRVVMLESDRDFREEFESKETRYLADVGYRLVAKTALNETVGNVFFLRE